MYCEEVVLQGVGGPTKSKTIRILQEESKNFRRIYNWYGAAPRIIQSRRRWREGWESSDGAVVGRVVIIIFQKIITQQRLARSMRSCCWD